MAHPPVVIVDANDKVVDWSPLPQAWRQRLIHRLVYVIVEDASGSVLLHQRTPGMVLYPNCWDTVAGHVDVTPDYEESARLELREEAGIGDADLEEVDYFYSELPYNDNIHPKRFIKIFRTRHDGPTAKPHDDEVAVSKWFTKQQVQDLVNKNPEKIAMGLKLILPYILDGYEDNKHQAAGQADRPVFHIR